MSENFSDIILVENSVQVALFLNEYYLIHVKPSFSS